MDLKFVKNQVVQEKYREPQIRYLIIFIYIYTLFNKRISINCPTKRGRIFAIELFITLVWFIFKK